MQNIQEYEFPGKQYSDEEIVAMEDSLEAEDFDALFARINREGFTFVFTPSYETGYIDVVATSQTHLQVFMMHAGYGKWEARKNVETLIAYFFLDGTS